MSTEPMVSQIELEINGRLLPAFAEFYTSVNHWDEEEVEVVSIKLPLKSHDGTPRSVQIEDALSEEQIRAIEQEILEELQAEALANKADMAYEEARDRAMGR